jgi:hypothetical protein
MNRKLLGLAVTILLIVILALPVMAIGPEQAADVGNNPNLESMLGGLINLRGEALGTNVWAYSTTSQHWVKWNWRDPTAAKGLMNNAIVVHMTTLGQVTGEALQNKWQYLSGDGGTNADQFIFTAGPYKSYGSHGMLWWLFFFGFGKNAESAAGADRAAATYPNGALLMNNLIDNNSPPP